MGSRKLILFEGLVPSNLWHCMQASFLTQIVTINCPQRGHKFRETESLYGVVSRMEIWDWSVKWAVQYQIFLLLFSATFSLTLFGSPLCFFPHGYALLEHGNMEDFLFYLRQFALPKKALFLFIYLFF